MDRLERNYCALCKDVLPMMGYLKLKDGCICKSCVKKASPFLKRTKDTTVEFMKRHLEYRKDNLERLTVFKPAISFGYDKRIYIDPYMVAFVVTSKMEEDIISDNPDIILLSKVKSCDTDIKEYTKEEFDRDEVGKKVSFFPPRIKYFYDFKTTIVVENEWFDKIVVDLNGESVQGKGSIRYEKCVATAKQIKDTLEPKKYKKNKESNKNNNLFSL